MHVVDKIISVKTDRMDKPYEDQVMESVVVDTFDTEYDEPQKL